MAKPAVGPVASALVSTGVAEGMVMMSSLLGGVLVPSDITAWLVTAYVVSGSRPASGQLVGLVHVVLTHGPPATGQAVTS